MPPPSSSPRRQKKTDAKHKRGSSLQEKQRHSSNSSVRFFDGRSAPDIRGFGGSTGGSAGGGSSCGWTAYRSASAVDSGVASTTRSSRVARRPTTSRDEFRPVGVGGSGGGRGGEDERRRRDANANVGAAAAASAASAGGGGGGGGASLVAVAATGLRRAASASSHEGERQCVLRSSFDASSLERLAGADAKRRLNANGRDRSRDGGRGAVANDANNNNRLQVLVVDPQRNAA